MVGRALIMALVFLAGCGQLAEIGRNMASLHEPHPEQWAVRLEGEGFENFRVFKQSDSFYRGGQPEPQQFKALQQMLGIRTVINTRRTHSDEKVAETLGLRYVSIPIPAWSLKEEHAVAFLKVMNDPANHPVYLYCWLGGDRSNALAAIYRVAVQGWCKDEAIREMTEGGNYFHPVWSNLVRTVRDIDIERVRKQAGYEGPLDSQCGCDECAFSDSRIETGAG